MAMLDQLTLASATPKRDTTPIGRFRRRLIDGLDLQIEMAKADAAGADFRRNRQRWIKTETGGKELREVPVRLRRWWWKDDSGTTYLALRHGAKLLEIAPGKRAIEVGLMEDLPGKLSILRDAVRAGELDACVGAVNLQGAIGKNFKGDGAPAKPAASKG
jgi:hypothetical protein